MCVRGAKGYSFLMPKGSHIAETMSEMILEKRENLTIEEITDSVLAQVPNKTCEADIEESGNDRPEEQLTLKQMGPLFTIKDK